jgi:hypothetical protein
MRPSTTFLQTVALVAVTAAVPLSVVTFGSTSTVASGITSFADISSACAASQDSSGFGSATLTRTVTLTNETDTLSVPCTLHLQDGAHLTIQNSTLTTRKLIVADDSPSTTGSQLVIANSTVTGAPGSGLLVQLQHADDSINVEKSTLDYPLSVFLLVQNTDRSGTTGTINAAQDTITSSGPSTDGIHLVADGSANFSHLILHSANSQDENLALLYAPQCTVESTSGAPGAC